MPKVFLASLLLLAPAAVFAQTDCAKPVVQLLRSGQPLPATAIALPAAATLRVAPDAGCPAQAYRFRHAEVTLVRNGRPVLPILLVEKPQADLRPFLNYYQTGDQLRVFIAYQNVATVAADGTLTPLLPAKDAQRQPGQLDLRAGESKGISLYLPLTKP
ncbi:hypothetical protein [Hymenobacter cellulosivorans]|uniref:DUF2141 domain-containing protein n=1 Tax=Hymenobacter cellulosivorans TaxID=2932249 RepID=A0ABY4F2X2_9BACT|nr:hypothetical protein [Hymenobacter cellulosivorans]UOQ50878.1 hypothetical protein MUN80_14035 [Hymenobacter cellulosivorans]